MKIEETKNIEREHFKSALRKTEWISGSLKGVVTTNQLRHFFVCVCACV